MTSIPNHRDPAKSDPKLPPGTNYCRCPTCGEYFGGVTTFDRHRVGPAADRACLGRLAMRRAGLSIDSKGYWRRAYSTELNQRAAGGAM